MEPIEKSKIIVSIPTERVFVRSNFSIEIKSAKVTEYGVEIIARAWDKNNNAIGFGDGTIEYERFKIHIDDETEYGWLTVPDVGGDITIGNEKYRYDPNEHTLLYLENIISGLDTHGSDNIIVGKIGNTVDTFTPHSSDGYVVYDGSTWSTIRSASTGTAVLATATEDWLISYDNDAGALRCGRAFFAFDTSSLPDSDSITAATLSIRQGNNAGTGDRTFGLVQTTQGSPTSLATSDYSACGSLNGATEGASRVTMNTADTTWTYTLNSTGLTWINKTGYTLLGLRAGPELDNASAPTVRNYSRICWSENATPAYRPTLTVTHSAGSPAIKGNFLMFV
jgi:hypothetical protein